MPKVKAVSIPNTVHVCRASCKGRCVSIIVSAALSALNPVGDAAVKKIGDIASGDMEQSLAAIHRAGIELGKIQVSSAMRVPDAAAARELLVHYAEPRYLHQVSTRDRHGNQQFCLDLADALADRKFTQDAEWRIHFHVPIQAERLDSPLLSTTRDAIVSTCRFLAAHPSFKPHLEVETYTWGVLPEALAPADDSELINAVSAELSWLQSALGDLALMGTQNHVEKSTPGCH